MKGGTTRWHVEGGKHRYELEYRRRRAAAGDITILPALERDLFSSDWDIRQEALNHLLLLGPHARGLLGALQEYRALYPWDEFALVVAAAIGGAEGTDLLQAGLRGPLRSALVATMSWAATFDLTPFVPVLTDIAAHDPRYDTRNAAQELLAKVGVNVLIAPDATYRTNVGVDCGSGYCRDVQPTEATIFGVTFRLKPLSGAPTVGPLPVACERAKKEAPRRFESAQLAAVGTDCVVSGARGRFSGTAELYRSSGASCSLSAGGDVERVFRWGSDTWMLMTRDSVGYRGGRSALQKVALDGGHDDAVALGGDAVAWGQERSGSLLFLLAVSRPHCSGPGRIRYLLLRVHPDLSLEAVGGLVEPTLAPGRHEESATTGPIESAGPGGEQP